MGAFRFLWVLYEIRPSVQREGQSQRAELALFVSLEAVVENGRDLPDKLFVFSSRKIVPELSWWASITEQIIYNSACLLPVFYSRFQADLRSDAPYRHQTLETLACSFLQVRTVLFYSCVLYRPERPTTFRQGVCYRECSVMELVSSRPQDQLKNLLLATA